MTLAITYAAAGDPADVLATTEIPDPPPPEPGQVQIKVRAFPIHPGDLAGINFVPPAPGERAVPGLEATGVVVAVGPGVSTPAVGTRVTVFPNPGSWAQRINVPAELAVTVPDSVSDDIAAQMVCNPLTALLLYRAAQQHFSVGFDGFVVNNAANSSVGRLFTAGAQHHQIATISVVRSAARAQEFAERYPNVPVISTDNPDWVEQVRTVSDGRPIPVALDPIGGTIAADLISLLSARGDLDHLRTGSPRKHPAARLGPARRRNRVARPDHRPLVGRHGTRTTGLRYRQCTRAGHLPARRVRRCRRLLTRPDHRRGPTRQPARKNRHRDRQDVTIRLDSASQSGHGAERATGGTT